MGRTLKKLYNLFIGSKRFEKEFKKQVRMLITFALGFTIAFSWRQTIFDVSQTFINWLTGVKGSSMSSILTSIFITFTSILLVFLAAHYLKDSASRY